MLTATIVRRCFASRPCNPLKSKRLRITAELAEPIVVANPVKMNWRRHWFAWLLLLALLAVTVCSQILRWSYKFTIPVATAILVVWLTIAAVYHFVRFMAYLARRRRWIVFTILVVGPIWLLSYPWKGYVQLRAVRAIISAGGSTQSKGEYGRDDLSDHAEELPLREAIEHVVEARIPGNKHPELCDYVSSLKDLVTLDLSVKTGADAHGLATLRNLETLHLRITHKPDDAFQYIRRLTSLKLLDVRSDEPVTDAGLSRISDMSQLEDLRIYPSAVSDAGLLAIQSLQLHSIDLVRSNISDAGLVRLHSMPLLGLYVTGTKVTNKGLQEIRRKIPRLLTDPSALPDAPEEAIAVKELERRGFQLDPDVTGHIITALDGMGSQKMDQEFFDHPPSFDELCNFLAQFKNLRQLSLNRTKASLAGVQKIATLKQLETLFLGETDINDEQLALLGNLAQLRVLRIDRSTITDKGLAPLSKLNQLEEVTLTESKLQGHTLDRWAGMTSLTRLTLTANPIDDKGLANAAKIVSLQSLELQKTKVTDAGLSHVAGLKNLQLLVLNDTSVSDAGLPALTKCPALLRVNLGNTKVTQKGIEALGAPGTNFDLNEW